MEFVSRFTASRLPAQSNNAETERRDFLLCQHGGTTVRRGTIRYALKGCRQLQRWPLQRFLHLLSALVAVSMSC